MILYTGLGGGKAFFNFFLCCFSSVNKSVGHGWEISFYPDHPSIRSRAATCLSAIQLRGHPPFLTFCPPIREDIAQRIFSNLSFQICPFLPFEYDKIGPGR